ncbi:GATA zinc finger domain containing 2Ab [Clupea harengus]|uniref:GATA zinc finger domain containing 2Ab n=1 Tax=Clupea harengus TaxID=7950 RepID=A0A6P3VG87_CLUHA|nr:GATA zinc finger domain containing 2Ab [Clupea harengus]XP_012671055.2 GATA zinc finger domain containing 2Ab [Clupea harengus]
MSEEAVRRTRSQKRALEKDALPSEAELKRLKLEHSELPADGDGDGDGLRLGDNTTVANAAKVSSMLKAGEVKATIKVELQTGDEPVDMSTAKSEIKKERPPTPDDVIVLSDNEPSSPVMNGLSPSVKKADTEMLMKSSPEERERIIKQLKEELRLQEAKLVLLKKLRQSQIQKDSTMQKPINSVATPPPLVRGSVPSSKGQLQASSGRSSGTVIPPPLVRGGQHINSKMGSQNAQIVMPPLVRGAQPISVTPQQIQSLRQQHQAHSGSGPPPLLLAPRASMPNLQGQRIIQQGLIRVANVPNTNVLVNISQASPTHLKGSTVTSQGNSSVNVNDSPASRQAAAKLALRKQLEKTLLEIPPPKPPAPQLNFLPSAANNEFIYLVGLEEVVQNLLDSLGRGKASGSGPLGSKEPFSCSQCRTDFTSRWRQDKGGTIMCEQCMSSNQKKALKAEHTTRLKAAFVKALQQEQEIEQRIMQQAASPISSKPSSSSSSSSASSLSSSVVKAEHHMLVSPQYKHARASSLSHQAQANRSTPVSRHHSTIKQSPGQLSRSAQSVGGRAVSHTFSTAMQLQNAVNAAALVSRPGKHPMRPGAKVSSSSSSSRSSSSPAATAWKKQNALSAAVTMAYVNPSLTGHKSTSAVERQREYLLDMIPSRSLSQTANTWK